MGVDYHIYTNLEVTFDDGEKRFIQIGSMGQYYLDYYGKYDSDEEGAKEKYEDEKEQYYAEQLREHSSKKDLFRDGQWVITSKEKIAEYQQRILSDLKKEETYNEDISKYIENFPKNIKTIIKWTNAS